MAIEPDESSLEAQLRQMPLRAPSPALDRRVEALFTRQHQPMNRFALFRSPALRWAAAAVVLIALVGLLERSNRLLRPLAVVPTAQSHPIEIEKDTCTTVDDGVIATTDDGAYVQTRRRVVRQIWYEDPATHAKLQVTIPVEQVMIHKVEAY